VQRGDQVRARREILGPAGMQEHLGENRKKQQSYGASATFCNLGQTVAPSLFPATGKHTTPAGTAFTGDCRLIQGPFRQPRNVCAKG
jgi:hypothetical protein